MDLIRDLGVGKCEDCQAQRNLVRKPIPFASLIHPFRFFYSILLPFQSTNHAFIQTGRFSRLTKCTLMAPLPIQGSEQRVSVRTRTRRDQSLQESIHWPPTRSGCFISLRSPSGLGQRTHLYVVHTGTHLAIAPLRILQFRRIQVHNYLSCLELYMHSRRLPSLYTAPDAPAGPAVCMAAATTLPHASLIGINQHAHGGRRE